MKVIIIGGGILGASTAYHLAKQEVDVVVIDRQDEGHATKAGAGIICPWRTRDIGEDWYTLANNGAHYYPRLFEALKEEGEEDISYKKVGGLVTSKDPEELKKGLQNLKKYTDSAPMMGEIQLFDVEETQKLFPLLSKELHALYIPGVARVDGHLLRTALLNAARKRGAQIIHKSASLVKEGEQDLHVMVDGEKMEADRIFVAAGAWAPELLRPLNLSLHIEPQRGQIVHLKVSDQETDKWPVVLPEGSSHYMLSFDDSRVVIGATRETGSGFDYRLTAGGVMEVLQEGLSVAPGLSEATLHEIRIGFRPMGPVDRIPQFGAVDRYPKLYIANGLGASGLTVGPYVGKLMASLLLEEDVEIDLSDYDIKKILKPTTV